MTPNSMHLHQTKMANIQLCDSNRKNGRDFETIYCWQSIFGLCDLRHGFYSISHHKMKQPYNTVHQTLSASQWSSAGDPGPSQKI